MTAKASTSSATYSETAASTKLNGRAAHNTNMVEKNPQPRNKDAEAGVKSNSNDGGFAGRKLRDSDARLSQPPKRTPGVWSLGATIVESPVGDREKNYWVGLKRLPAAVHLKPAEGGFLAEDAPEQPGTHDIHLRVNADHSVRVKARHMPARSWEFEDVVAHLGSSETDILEDRIRNEFDRRFHGRVQPYFRQEDLGLGFQQTRWGGVRVQYVHDLTEDSAGLNEESDGSVGFYTSNVMATLEDDPAYIAVRDGEALDLILEMAVNAGSF